MSWFDRKFLTLEEVLDLPCDSSKEKFVKRVLAIPYW